MTLFLTQNASGKAVEDGPRTWALAALMRDADRIPGSRLRPGPLLAIVAIWEVIQWMEELFLSLLLLSNKYIYLFVKKKSLCKLEF